ncbi:hypothetical protein CDD82_1973 [Ophiocordyceps australis]|uniref:Uncharacterized protein n=1 Tax=Ophiocordyceps australis TaxID=1399860 RepID=A0A2C5ZDW5_9HYPO|nr:hypothetical protein CDD82_1973 [Ophiocordyceps australis]
MPALDALCAHHHAATQSSTVSISGRAAPLIYALVSRLASLRYALLVVDLQGWFDATRLDCADEDLHHVHVMQQQDEEPRTREEEEERATAAEIRAAAGEVMRAAPLASRHRVWWGTVVIGADAAAGRVVVPLRAAQAWLRVERRGEAWLAECEWGSFVF